MKRSLRSRTQARPLDAFRPLVERLEDRNAPGDILSLAGTSLFGFSLGALWQDVATPLRDQATHQEEAVSRPSALTREQLGADLPPMVTPTASLAVVVPPAPVLQDVTAASEAELQDAVNVAALAPAFPETAQSVRRRNFDARWSFDLEEAYQRALPDLQAQWAREGVGSFAEGSVPVVAGRTDEAAALQYYAGQSSGSGPGAQGLRALILGDVNRDWVVDDNDIPGHAAWSNTAGMIYTVNFDDDDNNNQPDAINWADTGRPTGENKVVENFQDAADLAPIVIKALGPTFDPGTMQVILRTASQQDAESIHVIPWPGYGFSSLLGGAGSRTGATAEPTSVDITPWVYNDFDTYLGVEGLLFRNVGPSVPAYQQFDGYIDLTLEIRTGATVLASDTLRMKVAPWIMHNHTEPSTQVYAANYGASNASYLSTASADPGYVGLNHSGQLTAVSSGIAGTQWIQDHGEFGYTMYPGGPLQEVFFRLPYVRGASPQPAWPQTVVLDPNVGTFQLGVNLGGSSGDYGGNLEVTHPAYATGTDFLGKIFMGNIRSPRLFEFLQAQEVQSPFTINTQWLAVGHADEYVMPLQQWNTYAVGDTALAYQLMNQVPVADRGKAVLGTRGQTFSGTATSPGLSTRINTGINHVGQNWQYVRIYAGTGAGQIARVAPGGLQNGYILINQVWNTTTSLTAAFGLPSHSEWLLRSDAAQTAAWQTIPTTGSQYVLLQDTRFWAGGITPAAVTVHEVLADPNFLNLNNQAQAQVSAAKTIIENQVGGPGWVNWVSVPVLFAGYLQGGLLRNRSQAAFTPGLANVMPIGDNLYFARQFGFRNSSGQDVFETYTRAVLPNAQFVDDWNVYHALLGEVHCGAVATSVPGSSYGGYWWYFVQ